MSRSDDLDRMMSAWLDDPYTPPAPAYLGEVLEQTRRTRQRPAWASLERWLPMAVITRPVTAPMPLRLVYLGLTALLILALAAGIAVVGSALLRATAVVPSGGAAIFAFGAVLPDAETPGDIFTITAEGTNLLQLTEGPGTKRDPVWSPDGTRIAYHLWTNGTHSLVVIDADGGNPVTLATTPGTIDCLAQWFVSWSPDSESILFAIRDGCQAYGISLVRANGSSAPQPFVQDQIEALYGAWSPSGDQIAFVGDGGPGTSAGVYLIETSEFEAGGPAARIGPDLGMDASGRSSGPQWSPDGSEIAIAVAAPEDGIAGEEGVYIMRSDGSAHRQLVPNALNPVWSPDGRRLAFARPVDPSEYFQERPCTVRTWIIGADGSGERELEPLGDGCDAPPAWSPDGTRLANVLIAGTPEQPDPTFHLGFVLVDSDDPPVIAPDSQGGTWQPVVPPA